MDKRGCVALVGAGPGDPDLLTLAGKEALQRAEVVLYDRLAEEALCHVSLSAELVNVGKEGGQHPIPQDQINASLLHYARQGKRVVRLKGGDPYLFGRGGEEVEVLAQSGIPFRVIPGVTSALSAPAYAGIPVTHRDYASSVHIITGHGKDGETPRIPYRELSGLGGTLVFLMGISTLSSICSGLIREGMPPQTPAVLVENGSKASQRRLISTVGELPRQAAAWGASPPAVLVVGEVCRLADQCDWTGYFPLWGKRIAVAASSSTGSRLSGLLREKGCSVVELNCVRPRPCSLPENLWQTLRQYQWVVLTSPVGVKLFFDGLRKKRIDIRTLTSLRFAAVGPKTAEAIELHGIITDLIPTVYNGTALAEELLRQVKSEEQVLLFRAREGMRELPELLHKSGVSVLDIAAYETDSGYPPTFPAVQLLHTQPIHAVAFTSASAVEGFVRLAGYAALPQTALCIGESTAAAARAAGMTTYTSRETSVESVASLAEEILGVSEQEEVTL